MDLLGGKLKSPEQRPKRKREEKPLWRSIHSQRKNEFQAGRRANTRPPWGGQLRRSPRREPGSSCPELFQWEDESGGQTPVADW